MKTTITKQEIAEHYVTVEQLHEDLTRLIKDHFANKNAPPKRPTDNNPTA